jgi:hypothetical protein
MGSSPSGTLEEIFNYRRKYLGEVTRMEPTKIDATLTPQQVNKSIGWLSLLVLTGTAVLYWLLWGLTIHFTWDDLGLFLVITLVLVVVHELLHAVGFLLFARVHWTQIKFGVLWKALMPYAHCKVPVPIRAYRLAIALPIVILGIIPTVIGLAIGSALLTLYGAFMTAAGLGDVLILWVLRPHREGWVQDHPSKVGCELFPDRPS